jgi:glycosyltransferase involved in cell wall biosynthesis
MKIGFRLKYQKSDGAFVAFRVADLVQGLGYDVEFSSTLRKTANVHPGWDRYLNRNAKLDYYRWVQSGMSHVFFIGTASGPEIMAAKKSKVKTILIALWDEIEQSDVPALRLLDDIICPNNKTLQLLKLKENLENLHHVPWDPGVPLTQENRELDPQRLGLIWPLDGSQSTHQEPKFLPIAETILKQCPNVWMTITYSSLMPAQGVKELRRLYQSGDGRVELVRNPSWDKHQLLFGQHDITIWPTLIESVGLIGLCSLYMGTPVFAFDHPVVGEMVKDGKSGILVPCELQPNWLGVPFVKPDYQEFGQYLIKTAQDTKTLNELRGWTFVGLKERREVFNTRMGKILTLAE